MLHPKGFGQFHGLRDAAAQENEIDELAGFDWNGVQEAGFGRGEAHPGEE